jgi:hypothetical protein
MGLRPTQIDEKRLLFSNHSSLGVPPSPLSSLPQRRDLQFSGPVLGMFFDGPQLTEPRSRSCNL